MVKDKYVNAFKAIKVDDKVIERTVNRAYSRKKLLRSSLVVAITIILSLSISITAIASKVFTGSFVSFFIDIVGSESIIGNNIIEVKQTRVNGNYSITLEEVVADETTLYSLFTVKTLDGSPVYPKTNPVPYPVKNNPTYPVVELEATDHILINGGWFFNIAGEETGITSGNNWLRVDDLSDPSVAEIAMYTQFSPLSDKFENVKVSFDVNSIDGIAYNSTEKVNDTVIIVEGNWSFEFTLKNVMQSDKYTIQIDDKTYDVKITPISMTLSSDDTIPFVTGEQQNDNIFYVDFADGTSAKAIWRQTTIDVSYTDFSDESTTKSIRGQTSVDMSSPNAMTAIFNFESVINPENILAIRINNNVYSLKIK